MVNNILESFGRMPRTARHSMMNSISVVRTRILRGTSHSEPCDTLKWAREKDWGKITYYWSPDRNHPDENIESLTVSFLEVDNRERRAIHWCSIHVAPFDVFVYVLNRGGPRSLTKDATGMTPLHLLCLCGAPLAYVRQVVQTGEKRDVWEENKKKESPLDLAFQARAPYDVICYLMDLRGDRVVLFQAITEKNWELAEQYLTETTLPILERSSSVLALELYFPDSNFLHWACMFGAPISVFKLLLDKGINPNKKDKKGRTPLHLACYKLLGIDIINIIIEVSGDDLFEEDSAGLTPLIAAFTFNENKQNSNVIDRLLKAVELRTKFDLSQLYNYVLGENWESARKYLIDEGVSDIEKRTSVCFRDIYSKKADRTPLHWACRYSAPKDIIHLLIKYGNLYSVSYADDGHRTPLHIACQRNASLEVIEALVQVFATTESRIFTSMDKGGLTPLANACVSGASEEIIEYLLECQGLENTLRLKLNKKYNLLDLLLCKPTPAHVVEFIQQKWIEIDPFMTIIPHETVEKSLEWTRRKNRDNVHCFKGKFIRTILNEHFINKGVLSILMLDFYIQISLVTILTMKSKNFDINISFLVICETWILFRELLQLCTTPFKYYVLDIWNYVDLIQISSIGMYMYDIIKKEHYNTEAKVLANGDYLNVEVLANMMVWLCLIGVLKSMIYRIGIFVNAFFQIISAIIPFMVVTFLLLGAFANMFHVATHPSDNSLTSPSISPSSSTSLSPSTSTSPTSHTCKENIFYDSPKSKWFLKTFAMFLSDGWYPTYAIDDMDEGIDQYVIALSLIFGLIIGILILNIFIAKISNVFSEVDAKGRNIFWQDRLSFVAECKLMESLMCQKYCNELKDHDYHHERRYTFSKTDRCVDSNASILKNDIIKESNHRYNMNPLSSLRISKKEVFSLLEDSNDKSRRFDFSMASTKDIKKNTTVSERDQFFHWWMQPNLSQTPQLKTRITFFIKRELFSNILLPGQTFERILSGNKDKTYYPLTFVFGIFVLPCILIVFILGLLSAGLLWPKPLKQLFFFGKDEQSQEIANNDLSKNITVTESKINIVNNNIGEIKESLEKVNGMLSKILCKQDNASDISYSVT